MKTIRFFIFSLSFFLIISSSFAQVLRLSDVYATGSSPSIGTPVTLSATVSGGKEPYIFSWKNAQEKMRFSDVYVTGNQLVATFDDLTLEPESAWFGDSENEETLIFSGSYSFTNTYIKEWETWGGFAYSNMTETAFDPEQVMTHQFRSVVGSGVNSSENYAVVYPSAFYPTNISMLHNPEGDSVSGVYVTNSAYTMNSILNGDSYMGESFHKGDFYKVIFTGTAKDGTRSAAEYYLADYRSENEAEHYAITSWQWIDLSALGNVKNLTVSIDASRSDSWGLTLPTYFCMDDFGASKPIDAEMELRIKVGMPESVTLSDFFNFQDDISVIYNILRISDASLHANIENGILTVSANQATYDGEIWVSATQKGITKYGLVRVLTTDFIAENRKLDFCIFPIPTNDVLNIQCQYDTYQIKIYDILGSVVVEKEMKGNGNINVSQLYTGTYIFEIITNGQCSAQRFIKK